MSTESTLSPTQHRILLSAVVLLASLPLTACATQLSPTVAHVDGREVEVVEAGSGEATVVFEAGFGNDWSPWDAAASEVALEARVFAYSRPGYGASESTDTPRDPAHIVEDLRALLAARGYSPHYVLVGHSFGGTYVELFAKSYPDEVAALVLVDARHRDFTAACAEAGLSGCALPDSAGASLRGVERDEYAGFALAADQIAAAGGFGDHPVRVLTGTSHGFSQPVEALWVSMLGALAGEAEEGEQVVYQGAGHYLQLGHTAEVVEVVLSVLPATAAP
ncbi:MAG: alpha/beta hydrolase [Polyangiales bacterium]